MILKSRLLKVQAEQKEINYLKRQLADVSKVIISLKAGITMQKKHIENNAEELAQTPRHDFKKSTNIQTLNAFAKDFEDFRMLHPEEELSIRSVYIRGIVVVFHDNFQDIQHYLHQVLNQESANVETDFGARKRLANAEYYLGVNHANLGEGNEAIRFLEQAHKLDPEGTDLLTRLVMAEVYIMAGEYKKADVFLKEVDDGLNILRGKQGGALRNHQLLKQSRAWLMRANKAFLEKKSNWKKQVQKYTENAYASDADYYYAPFSLGQINEKWGEISEQHKAKALFQEAYAKIQESGHLHFVKETRIRILLLMVAAICGKHGGVITDHTFEKYLDEARALREDLPRIDNRICTVFSPLNKQNVSPEIIGNHIEEIRRGVVLLG